MHQGAFTRDDKPMWAPMRHASNRERVRVLHDVAAEIGATPNQVALAWLLGGAVPVIPVVGISSVAQLEEALAAADLVLDPEVRARLDAADLVLDAEMRARLELAWPGRGGGAGAGAGCGGRCGSPPHSHGRGTGIRVPR